MSQNGDSTLVEEFVVNRLMKKPKFEEVAKLLNDPSIIDMMIHGGTSNNSLIKAEIMSRFSFNDEEVDNIMEEIAKSASTIRREVYDEVNYNLLSIEVDKANEELAARGETLLNLRDVAEAQVR